MEGLLVVGRLRVMARAFVNSTRDRHRSATKVGSIELATDAGFGNPGEKLHESVTDRAFPGVRAEHLALRETRPGEVRGVGGEGRGEDRRDKRGARPSGTHVDVVHDAGCAARRGLPAHDGYPSGGSGHCAVPSHRAVSSIASS